MNSHGSHMTIHILHQTSSLCLNVSWGDECERAPAPLLNTGRVHM